jgi:hypothetical protein
VPRDGGKPPVGEDRVDETVVVAEQVAEDEATATGAITNGSSTLMRQKVFARMLRSSIAAMKRREDDLRPRTTAGRC